MPHKPSEEQAAIYDHTGGSKVKNTKIIAFAGAGKTTTLKGIAKTRRKDWGIYLTFNRSNADEAKEKLTGTRCNAFSMHQVAFRAQRDTIGRPQNFRANDIRQSGVFSKFALPVMRGWTDFRVASAVIRTMSEFANSASSDFAIEHAQAALISSVGDPDFIRDPEKKEEAAAVIARLSGPLVQMAEWFWLDSARNNNFSHDMYLKMLDLDTDLRRKAFNAYSYLMVDEAQDLNPVQRSIIEKSGIPIIAVGDPYQQIYSWRGAENALNKISGETFYLTQSFRFGENIAEVGRQLLAARPDGGPEQRLTGAGSGHANGHEGSLVAHICRTNMGVIEDSLSLMEKGKDVYVDNIGSLLVDLRSAQALFDGNMREVKSEELRHFNSWDELEMEADEGNGTMERIRRIITAEMLPKIEGLASKQSDKPKAKTITLCTAHRSKGMEWPGVRLGSDWKNLDEMHARYVGAKKKSEKHVTLAMEEFNALYVAGTRAISRLVGHEKLLERKPEDPILAHHKANTGVPDDYTPTDMSDERKGPSIRTL